MNNNEFMLVLFCLAFVALIVGALVYGNIQMAQQQKNSPQKKYKGAKHAKRRREENMWNIEG